MKLIYIHNGENYTKQVSEDFDIEKEYPNGDATFNDNPFDIGGKIENYDWIATVTQEELDAYNRTQGVNQIIAFNNKAESDGVLFYNEIKTEITLLLIGRADAMALMTEIKNTVYPMLNSIKSGDFPLAIIDYTDNNNNPTITEVVALFHKVGQKAIQYYADEYPH